MNYTVAAVRRISYDTKIIGPCHVRQSRQSLQIQTRRHVVNHQRQKLQQTKLQLEQVFIPAETAKTSRPLRSIVRLFREFFTDFENSKLAEMQYLINTLNRTYGIPIEDCEDCYRMIVKNAEEFVKHIKVAADESIL